MHHVALLAGPRSARLVRGDSGVATSTTASTGSGSRLLRIQGMPLGKWLTTTPGRFRLASVVLVGALVVALVVTAAAAKPAERCGRTLVRPQAGARAGGDEFASTLPRRRRRHRLDHLPAGRARGSRSCTTATRTTCGRLQTTSPIVARQVGSTAGAQKAVAARSPKDSRCTRATSSGPRQHPPGLPRRRLVPPRRVQIACGSRRIASRSAQAPGCHGTVRARGAELDDNYRPARRSPR